MTEPNDFLSRWSRRKREARVDAEADAKKPLAREQSASDTEAGTPQATLPKQAGLSKQENLQTQASLQADPSKPEDVFDLSKLPSLDSIGPSTDIRMFMQPGVPEALSRAALRRAWSADPGIRDFIGLAENSWDFTASDGMYGFGELDPADAKRLLAQLFGTPDTKGDKESEGERGEISSDRAVSDAAALRDNASDPDSSCNSDGEALPSVAISETDVHIDRADNDAAVSVASQHAIASVASQQKVAAANDTPNVPMHRMHGRALPQ